jgi:hypothetical protein
MKLVVMLMGRYAGAGAGAGVEAMFCRQLVLQMERATSDLRCRRYRVNSRYAPSFYETIFADS